MSQLIKDVLSAGASLTILGDVVLQGGDFIMFAAEYLVTPMVLMSLTVLPNVDLPADVAWIQSAMLGLTVVLAVAYVLNRATTMWKNWKQQQS